MGNKGLTAKVEHQARHRKPLALLMAQYSAKPTTE